MRGLMLVLCLLASAQGFAADPCNCKGYAVVGGPCYAGVGGHAYAGVRGPAYAGDGGACYAGSAGRSTEALEARPMIRRTFTLLGTLLCCTNAVAHDIAVFPQWKDGLLSADVKYGHPQDYRITSRSLPKSSIA